MQTGKLTRYFYRASAQPGIAMTKGSVCASVRLSVILLPYRNDAS